MTEKDVSIVNDDQAGLLDIVIILVGAWRLLVFGPLAAAILIGGLSFMLPKTYESTAIVRLTEADLGLLNATPVLDSLINKFELLAEFDGERDDARQALVKNLSYRFDKKTGFVTISVVAQTPERAQAMVRHVIDAMLQELLPKGKNRVQIESRIATNEIIISNNKDALDQLRKQMGKMGNDAGLEVVMKYYASLSADIAAKEYEIIELRNSLLIKGEEIYVQEADLPGRSVSRQIWRYLIFAIFVVELLLLTFVFLKNKYEELLKDQSASSKILTIRRILRLA